VLQMLLLDSQASPLSASLEPTCIPLAIELWSDAVGFLVIVADEDDARRLGEPRGTVYTAAEMRRVFRSKIPPLYLRSRLEGEGSVAAHWRLATYAGANVR
jgi:hypothetical protein